MPHPRKFTRGWFIVFCYGIWGACSFNTATTYSATDAQVTVPHADISGLLDSVLIKDRALDIPTSADIATKIDSNIDSRIDAHIDAKIDARIDARIDAKIDARIDARIDAKIDARIDAKIDARIDAKIDAKIDATPVTGCSTSITASAQVFSTMMSGCPGVISYPNRASLCAASGFHVCTAPNG